MSGREAIAAIRLGSIEDGCRQLAAILELDEPVSPAVLISAVQSEEYARNLLVCRRTPAFMQILLAHPVRPQSQEGGPATADLVKEASQALARWAKVGFSVVDDAALDQRLRACLACPNLRTHEAAAKAVYKLMKTRASCALCGCDVEKKARMSSEYCPGAAPDAPGRNRWGQPLRQ